MPKAAEVAQELRKIADALDKEPEFELEIQPSLYFSCSWRKRGKEIFLNLAKALPRPLTKKPDKHEYWLKHTTPALETNLYVERSKVCTLVQPAIEAKYKCEPLLSQEEESSLETA